MIPARDDRDWRVFFAPAPASPVGAIELTVGEKQVER